MSPSRGAAVGPLRIMVAIAAAMIGAGISVAGIEGAEEPTQAEEGAFRAAVNKVAGAVVRLEPAASSATAGGGAEGIIVTGPSSGLVIDAEADVGADASTSWIVTSSFTVPDDVDQVVVVRPDGTRGVGRVVGRDRTRALVLLKTTRIEAAPRLVAAPRAELEPGQWAIAVGRGWNQPAPGVSVGIVSATDRCWGRAVQTDAAVSPTNYGGPLLDIRGRVIGVLAPLPADTAGMNQGTELYDAGIGFAVPIEDVLRVLPRLRQGAPLVPGMLGITWQGTDLINGPPLIGSCRTGSPAARAGLRAGDRIVEIAGRGIGRIADARHQLVPRYAGDTVDVAIDRAAASGRERIAVRVELADRLPPWKRATIGLLPAGASRLEAPAEPGVVVAGLLAGGPAEKGGLRVGDRIESVRMAGADGTDTRLPIAAAADLAGILSGVEPAATVVLGYVRAGKRGTASVVTTEAPTDPKAVVAALPDVDPGVAGGGPAGGPAGEADAATIMPLEIPDERQRPFAVVPTVRAAGPTPLLIYCGPPRGPLDEGAAAAWKTAVARSGVAVLLPGSIDPQRWGPADVAAIGRAVLALDARRPVDRQRIGVAGAKAGGAFAWLLAERFGPQARGVAVIESVLPRQATIEPADPVHWKWVLFGAAAGAERQPRIEADRRRVTEAGHAVGSVTADVAAPPAELLCRWVAALGLL